MSRLQTLVLATRNRKKADELRDLLAGLPVELKTLADFPAALDVEEAGATFADNARQKAREQAITLSRWVLGEDSGLVVDRLGGRPGVYSARYAGADATDEDNNRKLLEELGGTPLAKRTAHYVCYVAVADAAGEVRVEAEGRVNGLIETEPHGNQGFGYDPLFRVREYHKTFGQLGPRVKRHLSHRARALEQLRPQLRILLSTAG